MYNEQLENLIDAALADGVLTEKEKQILFKKAQSMGVDLDEFEMVLDARLVKLQKAEQEKAASSAPKSNKYGDVKKCPVCGAIVPQLTGQCRECGYEFSVSDNLTTTKLREEIEKIQKEASEKDLELLNSGLSDDCLRSARYHVEKNTEERIDMLVNSFPIPSTKNDLYDFISFLSVKKYHYEKKYKEAVKTAERLFPGDPIFGKIVAEENEEQQKEKKESKRKRIGCLIAVVVIIIIVFVVDYLK